MHVSIQIIIAALSVMGIYFCLKTIASLIFTSRLISAAIIIENTDQLPELDMLLSDAESALFATRGKRLAVLIPKKIWNACPEEKQEYICEIARTYGAILHFTDTIDF